MTPTPCPPRSRRRRLAHLALALALLSLLQGCGAVGFFRYGIPRSRLGDLQEGQPAPDAPLVTLAGEPEQLLDHHHDRPLVLIFGSFT